VKTYVVCIDGTWNHPGQKDTDPIEEIEQRTETNVLRIFRFLTGIVVGGATPSLQHRTSLPLDATIPGGVHERSGEVLYLSGIGAVGTFVTRSWEGATGTGISERILDAYRFLAERHQPGDRIFGFGFSRGAFAVRSLAGFLQRVGLPSSPQFDEADVQEAYRLYRSGRAGSSHPGPKRGYRPASVDFLGLWDTVGSLAFRGSLNSFHLISPTNVRQVAHALALDEERSAFTPEYWDASGTQVVDEVWFSGVHSNVGGGYVNQELANISLAWMVWKAWRAGIPTGKDYIQGWYGENTFGRARASYDEFLREWSVFGALARQFSGGRVRRTIRPDQSMHASVFDRLEEGPSDYTTDTQGRPSDWRRYEPIANLAGGHPFPTRRSAFSGQVVDTPDYLAGAE